jgi:PAS domain S-box-containing protein
MPSAEEKHTPESFGRLKPFGIGARMAALVFAVAALTALAGGAWTYYNLSRGLVEEELGRQRGALESAAAQLTTGVEALTRDAAFLADVPVLQDFVQTLPEGGAAADGGARLRRRLVSTFEAKIRTAPPYLQIRLIGESDGGREIIRVERDGPRIVSTAADQLQRKGDSSYFQQARRMPAGAIYLSDIDLNREWGRVVLPAVPVLRAASPVYRSDGRLYGIIVINKDMRSRFELMTQTVADRYALFLFDERGYVLMDAAPTGAYKLPLEPQRLADRFAGLSGMLEKANQGHLVTTDQSTGERVLATVRAWHYDPAQPGRYYGLLVTSSYDAAIAPSVTESRRTVWLGLLLLAVTVGTVLTGSRKITQPLRELTQAVEDFGEGKADLKLPPESGDEAGTLTRAFGRVARQVRDQQAALEAEVAERRRAEESLRQNEQQLRLALDAAQAGIWVLDARTNANVWDERMERMFGLEPHTFAGTFDAWAALVHPQDRRQAVAQARLAVEQKQFYDGEFRARRQGDWRHIKSQAVVQRDAAGQPIRMIGVCWDITDSKRAQQQIRDTAAELERKNNEMEQFVYSVSHDLKSPLVTCKGFLGILNEDLEDGNIPQALEAAQRIEQATRRMAKLIQDLLQLSRVGRVSGEPSTVDVAALAADLIEEMRGEYDPERLRVEIQQDLPALLTDPTSISRILQNLLGNAFKYGCGAEQPRIEIGSRRHGEEMHYFVRDNGDGIPREYQQKIFGVFQRLDSSKDGTGIGLAIVTRIMEAHGGRVWVESESGQGTTFWLAFPQRFLAAVSEPVAVS